MRAWRTRRTPRDDRVSTANTLVSLAHRSRHSTDTVSPNADLQVVGVDDPPVVAQRLGARRLLVRRDERQPADLEQLRRREEHHLRRKSVDGVDEHALLEHLVIETALLGGDGGGQAGGPAPTMMRSRTDMITLLSVCDEGSDSGRRRDGLRSAAPPVLACGHPGLAIARSRPHAAHWLKCEGGQALFPSII